MCHYPKNWTATCCRTPTQPNAATSDIRCSHGIPQSHSLQPIPPCHIQAHVHSLLPVGSTSVPWVLIGTHPCDDVPRFIGVLGVHGDGHGSTDSRALWSYSLECHLLSCRIRHSLPHFSTSFAPSASFSVSNSAFGLIGSVALVQVNSHDFVEIVGPFLGTSLDARLCDRDLPNLSLTHRLARNLLIISVLPDPLNDLPWDSPCPTERPRRACTWGCRH